MDKNIGRDVLLAKTSTDDRGRYNISFTLMLSIRNREKEPDLQARVYPGETFLAVSDACYNATNREVLGVRLPANAAHLPCEYGILTAALVAQYNGELATLKNLTMSRWCLNQ